MAGVITHTQDEHFQAWQKVAKDLGFTLDEDLYDELRGIPRLKALNLILEREGLVDAFTLDEKHTIAFHKKNYYHELTKRIGPHDVLPGVERLFKKIKQSGRKIGLVSGSQSAWTLIEQMKLTKYFDAAVDLSKIGKGKPAPDIFLQVASKLQVLPEECICFDDGYVGIEGAKNIGMLTIGIGRSEVLGNADYVFESVQALEDAIIDKLLAI